MKNIIEIKDIYHSYKEKEVLKGHPNIVPSKEPM